MKQEVINYEFQILQNQLIRSDKHNQSHYSEPFRYFPWKLETTLSRINGSQEKQLKWIGNSESSYIIGYFYCLFKICAGKQEILIRLKHSLYKVCQYCLNLSQQKYLVQFVGLLSQDQPLICVYLQKNSYVQDLLVKIYQASISLIKLDTINMEQVDTFIRLKHYSQVLFTFLSIQNVQSCQNALEMRLMGTQENIFLLRQKGCYFILEDKEKAKKKQNKIRSLQNHSPAFQQCVIIDEQVDQEQTYIKDNSERHSVKRTPSPSKSSPQVQSISHSPSKQKIKRIPKFLCNNQRKPRQPRSSLHDLVDPLTQSRPRYYQPQKITLPVKQNYSNKILTNFNVKDKITKPLVPTNSIQKSVNKSCSKSYSKNSKEHSSEKHKKSQIKMSFKYPIKENIKGRSGLQTFKMNSVSGSFNNVPTSLRYHNYQSDQIVRVKPQETSLDKMKKKSIKNKVPPNFSNIKYIQETQVNYPANQYHQNQPHPNCQMHRTQNTRSGIKGRLSQSPIAVSFNYDFHGGR